MTDRNEKLSKRDENFSNSSSKSREKRKDKVKALTKVVIRRLPPTMTEDEFLKQIEPLPHYDFYYYVNADWSLGFEATCRAYINFKDQDDIYLFKDRFDGYVFVDNKGVEYPAVVEFAPFQGFPKNRSRKVDPKANTIESDIHYTSFLEKLANEENEKSELKLEFNLQSNRDNKITSTPLLQYLANKKQERRDDRKRKTEEKRRQRDDDRLKKKVTIIQKNSGKDDDGKHNKESFQESKTKEKEKRFEKNEDKKDRGDERKDRTSDKKDHERHEDKKDRYDDRKDRYDNKDRANEKKDRFDDRKERYDDRRDRYEDRRNRHGDRRDRYDDRRDRYDDRRDRYEDNKDSRSKRRAERDNKRREKKLDSKINKDEFDKNSENKPKEVKKYSESRRDKLRSREVARENEKIKKPDWKDVKKNSDDIKLSTSSKIVQDSMNDDLQELPKTPELLPKKQNEIIAHGAKEISENDEIKADDINETEDNEKEYKSSNDPNETIIRSNSFGNDKNKDNRESRENRRIRNKDRPSLQIYQPGKSRLIKNGSEGKSDMKETCYSASDCESTKSRPSTEKDEKCVKKRVSRYSERRSNKIKEKSSDDDIPDLVPIPKRDSIEMESTNSEENKINELALDKPINDNEQPLIKLEEVISSIKDGNESNN